MTGRSTTQLQYSAQRYESRRMERALRCGRLTGGPAPGGVGLGLGCLIAVVAAAGALVSATIRPGLADASIMLDRATGALYVRVGDTVHPALNLASARLIAGASDPRPVHADAIARAKRGPPLGIPGAPEALGATLTGDQSWTLCDDAAGTTLVIGPESPPSGLLDPQQAIPVRSAAGTTYVLLRGRRIALEPSDTVLQILTPRRVSALVLNAIPEAPRSTVPDLGDRLAEPPAAAVLCAHWRAADPAGVTMWAGSGLPAEVSPTKLGQADGPGPALDSVYLPPGRTAYIRASGVSGQPGGSGYLITDRGVRYGVSDDEAARSLGLPAQACTAPWPMLAGLPAGPHLSRDRALVARDVIPGAGQHGR